jgi:transposase
MKDKEIFIGIDVSKETLDISIAGKHYKIPNNKKSISGLYENHIIGSKVRLCVLE